MFLIATEGCKLSTPFDGVNEMLCSLSNLGFQMYIATNKRHNPTLSIIDCLGWSGYFKGIFSPDSYTRPLKNKSSILSVLLSESSLSSSECIYIGDRYDDYKSAVATNIDFILADWGYEELDNKIPPLVRRIDSARSNLIVSYMNCDK